MTDPRLASMSKVTHGRRATFRQVSRSFRIERHDRTECLLNARGSQVQVLSARPELAPVRWTTRRLCTLGDIPTQKSTVTMKTGHMPTPAPEPERPTGQLCSTTTEPSPPHSNPSHWLDKPSRVSHVRQPAAGRLGASFSGGIGRRRRQPNRGVPGARDAVDSTAREPALVGQVGQQHA